MDLMSASSSHIYLPVNMFGHQSSLPARCTNNNGSMMSELLTASVAQREGHSTEAGAHKARRGRGGRAAGQNTHTRRPVVGAVNSCLTFLMIYKSNFVQLWRVCAC